MYIKNFIKHLGSYLTQLFFVLISQIVKLIDKVSKIVVCFF